MKPTPTMTAPLSTTTETMESGSELSEQIRCRAYELYEQRGREEGHDLDDWLQAESEISATNVRAKAA